MIKLSVKSKSAIAVLTAVCTITPFAYAYKEASVLAAVNTGVNINYASSSYDKTIAEAEETKSKYEALADEVQGEIDSLSGEYDSILAYIQDLDIKQNELAGQVAQISAALEQLNIDKAETEEKLAEAEAIKEEHYKTMSARIKYVYENGETGWIDILLNAGSLSDLLNRVEYVSEISEYDDNLFNQYADAAKVCKEYSDLLDAQLASMEAVQESYDKAYELSEELLEAKNAALDECAEKLGTTREIYEEYMIQIESAQMTIEEAEEAKREEDRKAAEALAAAEEEQKRKQQSVQSTGQPTVSDVPLSDASAAGDMIWPLPGCGMITSYFGYRTSPTAGASSNHKGIDIYGPYGTPIVAAVAGTVIASAYGSSQGNYVMIDHGDGLTTVYMHMSSTACYSGQYVSQGTVIGYVGSTGVATGNHLHFGVIVNDVYDNPLNYVGY